MRKLSLLLAALMLAGAFHAAAAADNDGSGRVRRPVRRVDREAGRQFGRQFDRDAGQEFAAPGGAQFGAMGPRFMEELNLTAEQKKRMIDAATENFRERLTLRWEMQEARNRLEELRESDSPDYDALVAASTALGTVQGKLDVARRKVADEFAAILTPEQHERMDQYRERGKDGGE